MSMKLYSQLESVLSIETKKTN